MVYPMDHPALPPASVLTEQPDTVLVSQLRHDVRGVLTVTQPLYQPVSAPLREQGEAVEAAATSTQPSAVLASRAKGDVRVCG